MCSCAESALENELKISVVDAGHDPIGFSSEWEEFEVIKIRTKGYNWFRPELEFVVRPCGS